MHLTCWSCASYRPHGCGHPRPQAGWPSIGKACPGFDYEPGSDEAEWPDTQPDTTSMNPYVGSLREKQHER